MTPAHIPKASTKRSLRSYLEVIHWGDRIQAQGQQAVKLLLCGCFTHAALVPQLKELLDTKFKMLNKVMF